MLARLFLIIVALIFIIGIFDPPLWPSTKWGFIDTQGKLVIPAVFDRIQGIGEGNLCYTARPQKSFHEGLAAIAIGKLWGFVDKSGKVVIEPQYEEVGDFSEGLACAIIKGKCGFIDHQGKVVIPAKFDPHFLHWGYMCFHGGLCPAEIEVGQAGYINKSADFVIKPKFSLVWPFFEERAIVFSPNALIDTTGKIVFRPEIGLLIGNCSEGLVRVSKKIQMTKNLNIFGLSIATVQR